MLVNSSRLHETYGYYLQVMVNSSCLHETYGYYLHVMVKLYATASSEQRAEELAARSFKQSIRTFCVI